MTCASESQVAAVIETAKSVVDAVQSNLPEAPLLEEPAEDVVEKLKSPKTADPPGRTDASPGEKPDTALETKLKQLELIQEQRQNGRATLDFIQRLQGARPMERVERVERAKGPERVELGSVSSKPERVEKVERIVERVVRPELRLKR